MGKHCAHLMLLGLVAVVFAGMVGGCETTVQVDPPTHERVLVPTGFFTADSGWVVRVSHSVAYTDTSRPRLVDSATVEIWSNGSLVTRLPHRGRGTFAAASPGPQPDQLYTLRVSAPGYDTTEGTGELPIAPPIAAFQDTTLRHEDAPRRRIVRAQLTVKDAPGRQFYGLQIYQLRFKEDRQRRRRQLMSPTLFTFASDDPALGESPRDVLDTEKSQYTEAFFSDDQFDGEPYTLDFEIQYEVPSSTASSQIRRAFVVLFISASEDFYRYWTSAGEQLATGVNPFAEPLRVHSNMSGGLGVFAGFRYRLLPLDVDTLRVGSVRLGDLCTAAGQSGRSIPLCDAVTPR